MTKAKNGRDVETLNLKLETKLKTQNVRLVTHLSDIEVSLKVSEPQNFLAVIYDPSNKERALVPGQCKFHCCGKDVQHTPQYSLNSYFQCTLLHSDTTAVHLL